MDCSTATLKQKELLTSIADFARRSKELEVQILEQSVLKIRQTIDGHIVFVDATRLQDILMRTDADGRDFVQVNFQDGLKILVTERLIGFKPVIRRAGQGGAAKLPRVVTTPDLMSVLEAMEEASENADRDLSVLRELFDAIICGAERVGFDVTREKTWLLPYLGATPGFRASA